MTSSQSRRQRRLSQGKTISPPPNPPNPPDSNNQDNDGQKGNKWDLFWKIIGRVFLVLGIPGTIYFLYQWIKPQNQKNREAVIDVSNEFKPRELNQEPSKTVELRHRNSFNIVPQLNKQKEIDSAALLGILLPKSIITPDPDIIITLGSDGGDQSHYNQWDFYKGADLIHGGIQNCSISDIYFNVQIIGNRLFVSTVYRDAVTNELVGGIDYNKWYYYKGEHGIIEQTDTSLEVEDKRGEIITRVKFRGPNRLFIQGYFAGMDTALVVSNYQWCFEVDSQKKQMLKEIKRIKSFKWD